MKKWNSLKNLKNRGVSEGLTKKNLKRQSSSPYLLVSGSHNENKSTSLNKNYTKKSPKSILTQTSGINYQIYTSPKANNTANGTKSSHNRDHSQGKNKPTLPRSLSSKKIRQNNQTFLDSTNVLNPHNSSSNTKKIKRSSKASWK